MLTKSMITMGNINMPELIQIGQIPQSWSCERENTESENNMICLTLLMMRREVQMQNTPKVMPHLKKIYFSHSPA